MGRPALEVADIFRKHGPAWRDAQRGHLSLGQLKVMSAIVPKVLRAHCSKRAGCVCWPPPGSGAHPSSPRRRVFASWALPGWASASGMEPSCPRAATRLKYSSSCRTQPA
jgi:hypothetical protein